MSAVLVKGSTVTQNSSFLS